MNILGITGVGGFIGRHVAKRALARGLTVRGVDHSARALAAVAGPGVETIEADVCDAAQMRRALDGCDSVVHTAAIVEEGGSLERFRQVNVRGSAVVAEAARDASARRFVHLSSVMVHGFSFPPQVGEDGPLRSEGNAYCTTKIESEAAVRAVAARGFDVVVVRPGDVYGVGSVPWVERPLALLREGLFALPERGRAILNHVHVENLVDALFLALDRAESGDVFTVTDGRATTTREFFGYHARMLDVRPPLSLPTAVLREALRVAELAGELTGRPFPARAEAVDYLTRPHAYGIGRARARLGYAPRVGLEEGMVGIARELGLRDPTPR